MSYRTIEALLLCPVALIGNHQSLWDVPIAPIAASESVEPLFFMSLSSFQGLFTSFVMESELEAKPMSSASSVVDSEVQFTSAITIESGRRHVLGVLASVWFSPSPCRFSAGFVWILLGNAPAPKVDPLVESPASSEFAKLANDPVRTSWFPCCI